MTTPAPPAPATITIPRALFIFSIFYGGMVCIAGVLGNKQVAIGPLAVEAGIFAFLLLVVVSSAVAELYGALRAKHLVWFGFLPLLASMILSWIVWALPPSADMNPANRDAIQVILGSTGRIWGAGVIAYGLSQTLNVAIFDRLKSGSGKMLWLRAGIASVASQIIDTLIFVTVAFYGEFPIGQLIVGQMLAKVTLSVVLVPPLIYAFVGLGRWLDRAR